MMPNLVPGRKYIHCPFGLLEVEDTNCLVKSYTRVLTIGFYSEDWSFDANAFVNKHKATGRGG